MSAAPPNVFHNMWEALLAAAGVLVVVTAIAPTVSLYTQSATAPTAIRVSRAIPATATQASRSLRVATIEALPKLQNGGGAKSASNGIQWDGAAWAVTGFLSALALVAWSRRGEPFTVLAAAGDAVEPLLKLKAESTGSASSQLGLRAPRQPLNNNIHLDDVILSMMAVTGIQDLAVAPDVIGPPAEPGSIYRRMEEMLRRGQAKICRAVEECDGKGRFRADAWSLPNNNGGGVSMVMADGNVWEKAGCNLSVIRGTMPQSALQAATGKAATYLQNLGLQPNEPVPFFVASLSCVMHPRNPFCPTMHFNYRYFELDRNNWWFAGGTDITPAYIDEDDMRHFHGTYKRICDKYDPSFYPTFKKWADKYFLIPHRGETRGLGGIFFDDLNERDPETLFRFQEECLMAVADAYVPIVAKHKHDSFTEEQKGWQLLRRGRYTEFNLVYDRGTIFGLRAGGRIESILMSIPETARWEYCHTPVPGSEEDRIMQAFRNPREWV